MALSACPAASQAKHLIADSNHGVKMTGVGKLAAQLPAGDQTLDELSLFDFGRFAEGRTFGSGTATCPWV